MRLRPFWLAALLALPPVQAWAGALAVAPTRVELAPDQRAAALTLQNNAGEAVLVQIETFAWTGSPATEALAPTRDLVAVPAVATIGPGEKQLIRVALRGHVAAEQERSYRLLISEVPPELPGGRAGVRFALRLSLPVFVAPPGVAPQPVWSIEPAHGGQVLALANRGSAHLQVRRIRLLAAAGGKAAQVIDEPAYVLPGQSRQWPLPAGLKAPLTLKAETDLGELEATVAAPGR